MEPELAFIPENIPETVKRQEIQGGNKARRGLPRPVDYRCYQTAGPIVVDGRLDEESWQRAPWLGPFVDMEKGTPTEFDTRVAFLWDETNFYTAFTLEEPDVYAYETKRDGGVGGDCEVEVFILGEGVYYELEMNAINTVYEVFWTWFQPLVETGDLEGLDRLFMTRRAIYGSLQDDYPGRHGSFDWDFPGLQTAVQIDGSLNCRPIKDRGWTVEIAFPWAGWTDLAAGKRTIPPADGDVWRIGCSRVEHWRDEAGTVLRGRDWSICQHGKIQMHLPDRWPYVMFTDEVVGG
ncbi:MAG: carbohydrate-binding family 9-like protein [Candidatus Latescibacteria bacterium]|nr:carbohydrate-binding family 9-like protein [Candidatus Latescibacterota bacterium]